MDTSRTRYTDQDWLEYPYDEAVFERTCTRSRHLLGTQINKEETQNEQIPTQKYIKTYKTPIYLKTVTPIVTMILMVTKIVNLILLQ